METISSTGASEAAEAGGSFEDLFRAHYGRVAGIIARVTRDPSRAEELAVDVFLRCRRAHSNAGALLYRAALRAGFDELRRRSRQARYEAVFDFLRRGRAPSERDPEQQHSTNQERERVHAVLLAVGERAASLLLLRAEGMAYAEIASALGLQAASVGTLLARAQNSFRKEYERRYGTPA